MRVENELMELALQGQELDAMMDEQGISEEALLDAIEQHEYDLNAEGEKLVSLRKHFMTKANNAKAIAREYKTEADKYFKEARLYEARLDKLMEKIKEAMKALARKTIPAGIYEFFLKKNGGKAALIIDDHEKIPDEFYKKRELDNDKIREYLATLPEDIICPWAHLERGEHVEIKARG